MTQTQQSNFSLTYVVVGLGAIALCTAPAIAQIIPDETLGDERSVVTPNVTVRGGVGDRIDGGATRGVNLFHSFRELNVAEGQRVYFANPTGIETILSRVTGNDVSDILGTLGVDGGANLFLLNPNGILFGPNARLDVSGSFLASTATRFTFPDGSEFSASNPQTPPLLTVNVPIGLQLGTNSSGTITNTGTLTAAQDLTLSATTLDVQGQLQAGRNLTLQAQGTLQVRDSATTPFIAAAGGEMLLQGNQTVDIFALNHPTSGLVSGGDMVLRSPNPVRGDARYWSGGSFRVETPLGNGGDLVSPTDPIIRTVGDVLIDQYIGTSLHILAGGAVTIGTAIISASDPGTLGVDALRETLELSDGTNVQIDGGTQPTLDVRAGVSPQYIGVEPLELLTGFNPATDIFVNGDASKPASSADIAIGDVFILASDGLVLLTNQYQPNLQLPAGNISIASQISPIAGTGGIFAGTVAGGGSIVLDARNNITVTDSVMSTISLNDSGGDIALLAGGTLSFESPNGRFTGAVTGTPPTTNSRGGNLRVAAANLRMTGGAQLNTSTIGPGNAGDVVVEIRENALLSGMNSLSNGTSSGIRSSANVGATGSAGNIDVRVGETLTLEDNALISSGTFGSGKGGDITLTANQLMARNGGQINSGSGEQGTSGNFGPGGNVVATAFDLIELDGVGNRYRSGIFTETSSPNPAGELTVNAQDLRVLNGAAISSGASGSGSLGGDGGTLTVNATDSILISGTQGSRRSALVTEASLDQSVIDPFVTSNAGQLVVRTERLNVTNGGIVTSATLGRGNAGDILIDVEDVVQLDGGLVSSAVEQGAIATQASSITIDTPILQLANGATIIASTAGQGDAGTILIQDLRELSVSNNSFISTEILAGAIAQSPSNISIQARSLSLNNRAEIRASTSGRGNAGTITISNANVVSLNRGSIISTAVNQTAIGQGGNITIQTDSLELRQSQITARTQGQGDAGDIRVSANTIQVSDDGQFLTSTNSDSNAGDIRFNVRDVLRLNGDRTGLFANTAPNSTGNGGSIFIDPRTVVLRDGARIAVDSQGRGEGGNIRIRAGALTLANNALISAETASNTGGDIALHVEDLLLLRDRSTISTTAGNNRSGGNGGNISIEANFIVAVPAENSDITANAFEGRGGNIAITTQGIYGIEFREQLTPFSDITATSTFGVNGEVIITTPGIDPSRGLAELPTDVTDASQQIAQTCSTSETTAHDLGEFVITGRGGLPPNPANLLSDETVLSQFVTPNIGDEERAEHREELNSAFNTLSTSESSVVEAQGWVADARGNVILVAEALNAASNPLSTMTGNCRD